MNMNQPWKIILLIIGIFGAGAVSGYFVYPQVAAMRPKPKHPTPELWGGARMKKITERLGLTAEQEEKLRPIMQRDMAELGRIRTSSFAEAKKIVERMEHDIAELLTPEQNVKFEQMNREMRENMQRFMKERPFGPHDGPRKMGERNGGDEATPPPLEKPPGGN